MYSKYDNMHTNGMFYALFCINNHVLLTRRNREVVDFTRYCVKNNTELTNFGNL